VVTQIEARLLKAWPESPCSLKIEKVNLDEDERRVIAYKLCIDTCLLYMPCSMQPLKSHTASFGRTGGSTRK
jgi:hypothetical protein